jgi:hypothetical protein
MANNQKPYPVVDKELSVEILREEDRWLKLLKK